MPLSFNNAEAGGKTCTAMARDAVEDNSTWSGTRVARQLPGASMSKALERCRLVPDGNALTGDFILV